MKEIQTDHNKQGVVASDEYYTPIEIIRALGHFDLDPCAPIEQRWKTADRMLTKEDDGLSQEWKGRVWLNPPYSRPLIVEFMKKMARHGNGVALIIPKLGTKMFREDIYPNCKAIFILRERIKFYNMNYERMKSPVCQSMLVAYSLEDVQAIRDSGLEGQFLYPEHQMPWFC